MSRKRSAVPSALKKTLPDGLMPRDTRRSLPMALLRAREALMARFRPLLAEHDVTEQQWRVLRVLSESERIEAAALAERACVLAPSLTRMIRTLEERRLLRRGSHASDGRRVMLEITAQGRALIDAVAPASSDIYAGVEAAFGRRKIEALLDQLQELDEALSAGQ